MPNLVPLNVLVEQLCELAALEFHLNNALADRKRLTFAEYLDIHDEVLELLLNDETV